MMNYYQKTNSPPWRAWHTAFGSLNYKHLVVIFLIFNLKQIMKFFFEVLKMIILLEIKGGSSKSYV